MRIKAKSLKSRFALILACGLFSPFIVANPITNLNQAYQEGAQTGNNASVSLGKIMRDFKPEQELSGFTSNPRETTYHTGTEQSFNALSTEGARAAQISEAGKAIYKSLDERPLYRINPQEQGVQRSKIISDNAAFIAQGISNSYVDCKEIRECRTSYTEQTCQESSGLGEISCTRDLVVQAIPPLPVTQTITIQTEGGEYQRQGWFRHRYKSHFILDLKNGHIVSRSHSDVQVSSSPALKPMPCEHTRTSYTIKPIEPQGTQPVVTLTQQPNCQNGFQAGFKVTATDIVDFRFGAIITLTISATPSPDIQERWSEGCQQLEARQCTKLETQCTQPHQTRTINNIPITRPCWQERVKYRCGAQNPVNTCTPLRDRGCEQMNSQCIESLGNQCVRHEQTFRCPQQTCNGNIGVICNNSKFCLQGDCTQAKPLPYNANQMAKDLSVLSGTAEASKQFDVQIFQGRRQACRKIPVGFLDCCADKGWGRDAGLAQCNNEEKELGHNKQKNLVLEGGEYCSRRVLGVCLQRSKTYCTFQSKLAKIIQQQGRIGQLGIPIGGGEHPNCRGLLPEELQRLDFDKIDFTEFYDDLREKIKLPNEGEINQRIRDAVQRQQQSGRERP